MQRKMTMVFATAVLFTLASTAAGAKSMSACRKPKLRCPLR